MQAINRWFSENIQALARDMRWSYLPPLMVYVAAGIQGLTGIVGTFFVKDYLGLSAEFLAALGFWAFVPWSLKMPIGHLVDLIWRFKAWLVILGAALIATSLLIMAALIGNREWMASLWSLNAWYVLAALLSPVGYVLQDVVADAMTVEAVPNVDSRGQPTPRDQLKRMHTTMQTLGRVAIIGGTVLVALINLWVFKGSDALPAAEKLVLYRNVYLMALVIPVVSVMGLVSAALIHQRQVDTLVRSGLSRAEALSRLRPALEKTTPNWWILGGSLVFVSLTLTLGMSDWTYSQEAIFLGSTAIILWLMKRLVADLDPRARQTLVGTAVVIFLFRATPSTGPGVSWWMIDELKFDGQFFSVLSLIGSTLTLFGMFAFRRFMAERPITYVIGFLTLAGFVLSLPTLGMSMGMHVWTAQVTGGVVDARFIALVDTALESPLGQIAMIPMLAWIANAAPSNLKATYFAVMASFTNLALSAGQLGTKYVNQWFTITREVKDPATQVVQTAANYSELTPLLVTVIVLGLVMPLSGLWLAKRLGWQSA
jgi:MFS family permease